MKIIRLLTLAAICLSLCTCSRGSSRTVIQNKGSDTLVNVAQTWAENYKNVDPGVAIAVAGGGTGTGMSALINGTVDIANASREMTNQEIEQAKAKGITPVKHVVGYDALAVFVHKDNPLQSITIEQLAEIYGDGGKIDNWSKLGISIPGVTDGKMVLVSRQNNSGTYVYFKEAVLGKREYRMGTLDMHGSKDVVDLVEKTPSAIGYSGLAYATGHVKMIPIVDKNGKPVLPTVKTAADGTYPIARPLLMITAGQPTKKIKAYIDWILSDAGQRVIMEKGYAPAKTVRQ